MCWSSSGKGMVTSILAAMPRFPDLCSLTMIDEMTLSLNSTLKLASGSSIPRFGLGVYQSRGEECCGAVVAAIKAGYRHGG